MKSLQTALNDEGVKTKKSRGHLYFDKSKKALSVLADHGLKHTPVPNSKTIKVPLTKYD